MDFTLGSDPELMLFDKSTSTLRSAIPLLKGTKTAPVKIPGGVVIHDNVNAEFGITPAKTEDDWVDTTGVVLRCISQMLPRDVELRAIASADYPTEELLLPEAREFACDPDFDPYVYEINFVPDTAADETLRSCGGHIHIGADMVASSIDNQGDTAKAMDVFLGIPSLLLDKDPSSHRRRELYGKAGAHRPKTYGVEYRALGNFWVSHPKLARLMHRLTRDGLAAWENGHLEAIQWGLVRKTINNNLLDKAEKAIKGLIAPLLQQDSRELLATCLEMPQANLYDAWGL